METELTVKVKFQIGDKVKVVYGDLMGVIDTISIQANNRIHYSVDYVTKEGESRSNWFEDYQLEKVA